MKGHIALLWMMKRVQSERQIPLPPEGLPSARGTQGLMDGIAHGELKA